jgi:hypothetical protein
LRLLSKVTRHGRDEFRPFLRFLVRNCANADMAANSTLSRGALND